MILCCRVPDIPIAALVLREADPGLLRQPVVVGGHPSERKPVRAASAEARAFGIVPGMPLRQAEQLCPEARFFPVDLAAEADLARHLLAGLYALAPRVELGTAGEAYVEVDGLGDTTAFAARVADYLEARLKTRPALGIGAGKFVAATAAALHEPAREPVRLVPKGAERSFLAPLSVDTLAGYSADFRERLKLFGLRRLGDLARMPLAAVEAQFGAEGLAALRLARGEDSRPLRPWEPPRRMEERSSLDPAVDNLTPLLFLARGLVDRLGARLLADGCAATVVRLRLESEDAQVPEQVLRLRVPMSSGEELWGPVSGLLQRQVVTAPVSAIRLRVSGFCPAGSRQMDLLARRDGRLEDILRQVALLADGHGPELLRMAETTAAATALDERRHRWVDPTPGLERLVAAGRSARRRR